MDEDWKIGLSKKEGFEIVKKINSTGKIDFLNITPGAVVTENTKYLEKTIFDNFSQILTYDVILAAKMSHLHQFSPTKNDLH